MRIAEIHERMYQFVDRRAPEMDAGFCALVKAAQTLGFTEREMRGHIPPEKVEILRAALIAVVDAIDAERAAPRRGELRLCGRDERGVQT